MEKEWKIKLYKTKSGRCPVEEFMKGLTKVDSEDMLKGIQYLRELGNDIRRPYADYLRDKIYELRITLTNNATRILYFFCFNDCIVLTHAFNKKTQKVPKDEIEKAIKYKNDFLQRYNITNIKEA